MKVILASVLVAVACTAFVGCESDLPPDQDAGRKLERGFRGQGTLYQPDRSNDPVIREESRVGY